MDENVGKPSSVSKGIIVVVLVVIVVLAAGVYEFNKSKSVTPNTTQNAEVSPSLAVSPSAAMQASAYKDGEYTAEGEYISPGGQEMIDVSLVLKDGKITDVTVTPKATRPTSKDFQGKFADGYKPLVMGKSIDEVTLDVVSGSSLTPKGFNDAITKIKDQAKS